MVVVPPTCPWIYAASTPRLKPGTNRAMSIKLTLEIDLGPDQDPAIREAANHLLHLIMQSQSSTVLATPPAPVKVQRKRRRPPQRTPLTGTPAEQWKSFIGAMPERTQRFVELMQLKAPQALDQMEAMRALDIETPRAIGGLTGSLRRWARADGLQLPWTAYKEDGERVWLWHGYDDHGNPISPPTALQDWSDTPKKPSTYAEYFERLPERSQAFLTYLEHVEVATVRDVMADLDIEDAKALGGLAGSISRWGRAAGIPVPFENTRIGDERAYRWTGPGLEDQ